MDNDHDVKKTSSGDNLTTNNQTVDMANSNEKGNNQNVDSEYESIYDSSNDQDDENVHEEEGFESEGSVGLEREEGDGQESVANKKVDDDEDKKNPQYIPKRGTFYEHDDRTMEESNENREEEEKVEKQNKKIVWVEKKERWSHDRYNDNEQAPKSRSELVAIYGYDIRNEDGPPKARRRRRYGRGPNKYTRTWEDEDAYKATKPVKPIKTKSKNREEYPPLSENNEEKRQSNITESSFQSTERHDSNNEELEPPTENPKPSQTQPDQNVSSSDQTKVTPPNQRAGTGRVKTKSEIQRKDYRGFTKSREFSNSNSKSEQAVSRAPKVEPRQDYKANEMENLEQDMNQINIQDHASKMSNKQQSNHRQNNVPPRLQAEQKGSSKRYSSLRQRSLPETATPNYSQAANYYPNEYTGTTPTAPPPSLLPQPTTLHAPTQVTQIPPPPLATLPQPVSVTSNPILQAPPPFATTFPQPAAPFLSPPVATPPFLPQQAPPLINYVQSQAQFPPQAAPYQGYQQFNANTADLYQCQGGTTYYSTQGQQLGQRMVPQKRPKAAIPIVAPPIPEPRGRGRSINNHMESPPLLESTVCETIISENCNYEDIVYVQQ
ncbi:protein CASC3 isoform X2 [Photinus pyralis]|uniref:protein CASC3 isoform X2 n=1 Tax=Photinus pyralis TaxID=7054 RepID=UPI001267603F|nr:protein CASC3 isoform X2 [Photinus pyralis]